MAQLHRRVRRVQNLRLAAPRRGLAEILVLGLALGTLLASAPASAAPTQPGRWENAAPSAQSLKDLGALLVDADGPTRTHAYEELRQLPETAMPAIRERFSDLARRSLETDGFADALTRFRRAVGSTRADDDVDLAPGVPIAAAETPTESVATAGEVVLLMRSLEALRSPEAGLLLAEAIALAPSAFAQEGVRVRNRLGARMVPTYLELRGHKSPEIRRWAARSLRALGVTDSTIATQQDDPMLLGATLRAYGLTHDLEALPTLMSFLNDSRIQVHTAARGAVRGLGRNAIWKLRIAYQEVTGKNAESSWTAAETLDELCLLFDRARIEAGETALARGVQAHLAGDLLLMATQFEKALRIDPLHPRRSEMAPGFAALGAARASQNDLAGGVAAYLRALRVAPEAADSAAWKAQLGYLQAERALTRGVVDLPGYRGVLEIDARHVGAADAVDRLSGAWSARAERMRRLSAVAAILILSAFGFGMLRLLRLKPMETTANPPGA